MGQVRHGCATTTHAIRPTIQRSQATNTALSRYLGIDVKTVAKWRKRETVEDRKTGPIEFSNREGWRSLARRDGGFPQSQNSFRVELNNLTNFKFPEVGKMIGKVPSNGREENFRFFG